MDRNVVFGASLAALIVGTTVVLSGGSTSMATPVPAQGKPLPGLAPLMESGSQAESPQPSAIPAPVSSRP